MLNNKINSQINKKKSFLCIGLDIDINRIPNSLINHDDPIFEFAKQIIDSTNQYAIALAYAWPRHAYVYTYLAFGFSPKLVCSVTILSHMDQCRFSRKLYAA